MVESLASVMWSKSLKHIPYFDLTFVGKWLEKDGKVPKKVITYGYSNFCEGYIFDIEGKEVLVQQLKPPAKDRTEKKKIRRVDGVWSTLYNPIPEKFGDLQIINSMKDILNLNNLRICNLTLFCQTLTL